VRDIAAHLTLQNVGLRDTIGMMVRWRGSLDRTIQHAARRRAALPTDRLIAEIRGTVGSRRHSLAVTYLKRSSIRYPRPRTGHRRPLGRRHDMPPEGAAVAATRVLPMRGPPPFPSARKVAGFRLTATDTSWSFGEGPEIRGPIAAILLVCAGRLVALPQLSGAGAADRTARLWAPATA
jgi:hypothetical protein